MAELAINGGSKVRTGGWPSWPVWDECETSKVVEAVESGQWGRLAEESLCGDFEQKFAEYQDAEYGVVVTSGTAALTIALKAVGVDVGDEVIVPPYTFIASATSVLQNNAVPVFVDVDIETRNMDPDAVEAAITDRTTAIMPVHFSGRACDMDRLMDIADRHNLAVIEDACHSWGAEWNGTKMGALGDIGAVSFQSSKHITCGEGGIILTNDEELAGRAYSYHHIGRIPGRPFYEHHLCGWNFRMNEVSAAMLLCQFERLDEQTQRRHENGLYLDDKLGGIEGIIPLRREPYMTRIARHVFGVRFDEQVMGVSRDRFRDALAAEGIPNGTGYPHPLYKNPLFAEQRFGRIKKFVDYPDYGSMYLENSERLCDELIVLSQQMLLADKSDMDDIVEAFHKVADNRAELQ
ncbi:MAG: DegT/DnrJ/EryC1/StrS family aminotransferase [Armatimonadota bacterium]